VTLLRRIAALERFTRQARGEECAECGGPPLSGTRYALKFDAAGDRADGPERCPACGRQLVFRLEFDRAG
jgi:hypothetical protein